MSRRGGAMADRAASWRVIRRAMFVRPRAYWGGAVLWWVFLISPLGVGLLLERLFDALGAGGPAIVLLAAVTGVEVTRALLLPLAMWVFEPFWTTAQTALRTNVLRAQLHPDPAYRGPPLTDAAAALPLFREDPEHVSRAADNWIDLTAYVVVSILALAVLASIGPAVAAAVAIPLLLAAAAGATLAPIVRRRRAADRAVTAEVTGQLGEVFGAVTTIATAGAAPAVLDRLTALCRRRRITAVRDRVAEQLMRALGAATADLALAVGVLTAVLVVDDLTAGQVALLASYAVLLAGLPRYVAVWLALRRHADVAVERLRGAVRDGDVDHLVAAVPFVHAAPPPLHRQTVERPPSAPRLELRGLVARAPDGSRVGPVDLDVPAGGFAVITGRVGTGKTTLVRALLGLAPVVDGEVVWDGEPVDPTRWMVPPRAAYVAQVPTLFGEALDDNLRLGRDLTDAELHDALAAAGGHELVGALDDGLATRLGPRGVRLSGGQVHRVAVARSLASGAALVVADDLSAALDAPTEAALLDGLLAQRDRTVLVVSHRPAVLARADVVLDLGS